MRILLLVQARQPNRGISYAFGRRKKNENNSPSLEEHSQHITYSQITCVCLTCPRISNRSALDAAHTHGSLSPTKNWRNQIVKWNGRSYSFEMRSSSCHRQPVRVWLGKRLHVDPKENPNDLFIIFQQNCHSDNEYIYHSKARRRKRWAVAAAGARLLVHSIRHLPFTQCMSKTDTPTVYEHLRIYRRLGYTSIKRIEM